MCNNNSIHLQKLIDYEYVCVNCCLVFDQEYKHQNVPKIGGITHKNKDMQYAISNFLETLHINHCFTEKIEDICNKYLNNFYYSIELKLAAAVYFVLSNNNVSFTIRTFSNYICIILNSLIQNKL